MCCRGAGWHSIRRSLDDSIDWYVALSPLNVSPVSHSLSSCSSEALSPTSQLVYNSQLLLTETERAIPNNNTSGNVHRTDRIIIYGSSFHSGIQLVSCTQSFTWVEIDQSLVRRQTVACCHRGIATYCNLHCYLSYHISCHRHLDATFDR